MIGAIASMLLRAGIADRWARPLAWALLVGVIVCAAQIAWSSWISRHDQVVVAADRAATTVQVLNSQLGAEQQAGAAKDARDAATRNEQSNLQEKADAAADDGASPLDALFNELR